MNDRFKFRAWDKEKKDWVSPYAIGVNLIGEIVAPDETYLQHNPADLILMQSTGIRDKNGTLIYEGDIVKNDEKLIVIKWDVNYEGDSKPYSGFILEDYFDVDSDLEATHQLFEAEIIGNIYKNPDLLK
jgi:uncharacterized phage protein (TIGR01671 family)